MKRVFNFFKADVLKVKPYAWILLFPVIAIFVMIGDDSANPLFGIAYCLFAGIIFAVFPFNSELRNEVGFLQMLPAKPGEQILGHFLFGFMAVMIGVCSGFLSAGIAKLFRPSINVAGSFGGSGIGILFMMTGLALLFTACEEILFTVFRFKNAQVMAFMRMIPGFVFFFGVNAVTDQMFNGAPKIEIDLTQAGVIAFACGILVYAGFAFAAARIQAGRE